MANQTKFTKMHRARHMRSNPTPAETKLWNMLRKRQIANARFRRQHTIGPYIVDFCAPRRKLIIEVDGSQHLDQRDYDQQRTAFLANKGYRVLRFWNNQVMHDLNGVICAIENAILDRNKNRKTSNLD